MQPTYAMEDMKVIMATATGIMLSYIQVPTMNNMRWIVLILTMLYTLRRWYIMEKNENIEIMKYIDQFTDWVMKPRKWNVPNLFYLIVGIIIFAVILRLIF